MAKVFKQATIASKLDLLKVDEKINKSELIKELYGADNNFFESRSFDVLLCLAKKSILPKEFNCKSGIITRIK